MVEHSPCTKPVPTPRRRPAKWRDYQIDHSELQTCAPAFEWPELPAQARLPANDDRRQDDPIYSQADLAKRLGVCVETIARARKRGRLIGHLIEGQWRFSDQQFADYKKLTTKPLRLYGRRSNPNDPS